MVGSFIVLAIALILRITFGTLADKFSWVSRVIPYLNYGVYGALGLVVLFVIIALIKAIGGGRRSGRK